MHNAASIQCIHSLLQAYEKNNMATSQKPAAMYFAEMHQLAARAAVGPVISGVQSDQ